MTRDFSKDDEAFMRLAIEKTREGIANGQTPFGACIVKDGRVIACAHNVVWGTMDITAHGEIAAIRGACRSLKAIDLSGSVIYSTTEPCPMCFSAIHWSRIKRIVYGASIADARAAGFNELAISNDAMKSESGSSVESVGGCLRAECVALFKEWKDSGHAKVY
jgi:tRNA(Arg) A34 adenosine deaminase TadA